MAWLRHQGFLPLMKSTLRETARCRAVCGRRHRWDGRAGTLVRLSPRVPCSLLRSTPVPVATGQSWLARGPTPVPICLVDGPPRLGFLSVDIGGGWGGTAGVGVSLPCPLPAGFRLRQVLVPYQRFAQRKERG